MSITASSPRLMVGVPTGYLSPQIPPPNTYHVNSVGVEIEPGLGISLDGKAILVGPKDASEKFEIIGHLSDGTMPQRDFQVTRQGLQALVNGYYDNQDYSLNQQGNRLDVKGSEEVQNYSATYRADGIDVASKYPARAYTVNVNGSEATVVSAWQDGPKYKITQEGNTTRVDAGSPEGSFTFTRKDDGSIFIDGQLKPQDFDITRENGKLVVQGYYPQQHYVIG
ncbi:MAG: hypothetical protein U0931_15735 [Vulcanimicrobiota bacterium]